MTSNRFVLSASQCCVPWIVLCFITMASGMDIGIEDRYWTYGGQKVLLIGGWNHGHNPFLDHDTMDNNGRSGASTEGQIIAALDEMVEAGGNLLRCVLDPGVGAGVQGFDFCARSGDLYDLSRMTGPYWTRLDFFLRESQRRRIIVQIEIWDRFDWYNGGHEGWPNSPFNPKNNVNYSTATSGLATSYPGKGDKTNNPFGQTTPFQSAYKKASQQGKAQFDLVRGFQEKFMDKLLSVTFAYDNVLYSANNEVRHQEPAWGRYWINYIKQAAAAKSKQVLCTDMFWDLLYLPNATDFDYLMAHTDIYDYFDISQISAHPATKLPERQAGNEHWKKAIYAAKHAKQVDRLIHMNKIYGSVERTGSWMGSDDNAVDEFWRGLIAGVAGVRFHRPESGIGLSEKSKNCMRALRLLERKVKFWEVEPRQNLLTDCGLDEAYLAAKPGEKYILFFTDGGSVGLKLNAYADADFELTWIDIDDGRLGPSLAFTGGKTVSIEAPGPGHWVAAITLDNLSAKMPARIIVPPPSDERFCHLAWPKIVKADDGTLVVAYIAARKHAHGDGCPAVSISTDQGRTFTDPKILMTFDKTQRYQHGANLALGKAEDGALVLLVMAFTYDECNSIFGWRSEDAGKTWQRTDTSTLGDSKTGSVFGHVFHVPGKGLAVCGHYRQPKGNGIWIAYSKDQGRSWGAPHTITTQRYFEPTFIYTQKRLIGLVRHNEAHAFHQYLSDDLGKNWTFQAKALQGDPKAGHPSPFLIEDPRKPGRLYALLSERNAGRGIHLWQAQSFNTQWKHQNLVTVCPETEDYGYPWMVHLEDDKWFLVFYAGQRDGPNAIYGMTINLPV